MIVGQIHAHGVVNVILLIELLKNGALQPGLPGQVTAADHDGLGGVADPKALVLVIPVDPGLLQGGEAVRQAEGIAVADLPGLGVNLHHNQAGIGIRDHQLHLGQNRAFQVIHILAGMDMIDDLIVQQKVVFLHGDFLQSRHPRHRFLFILSSPPAKIKHFMPRPSPLLFAGIFMFFSLSKSRILPHSRQSLPYDSYLFFIISSYLSYAVHSFFRRTT